MKTVAALLLLFSTASGLRPWSVLPATEISDQNWLKGTEFEYDTATAPGRSNLVRAANGWVSGHLSDHLVSGSYGDSLADESEDDIGQLVDALHSIIPPLKRLKEKRDNLSAEYAQEFAEMLINHASDHELKITLGRHVRLLFGRCHYFQVVFLHIANESGLFQVLNDALETPEFDTVDLLVDVLNAADHHDFGMFDRIAETIKEKGLQNNPAMKAFSMMSKLFTKTACGEDRDVDGLLSRIGDIVHSVEPNVEWEIEALASPFGAQKDACATLQAALNSPEAPPKGSLKLRLLTIVFEPCKDVEIVHYVKETTLKGLSFFKSMHFIQQAVRQENIELSRRVGVLLEHGKTMEADALVGARVLHDMRIGLLIDLAVGKELEHERPKPKPTPQRSQNDTLVPRQKMHNPLLRSLKKAPTQHRKIEDDSRNSLKKVPAAKRVKSLQAFEDWPEQ